MQPVLIDTSTWIRLFRGDPDVRDLPKLLRRRMAHTHPWSLAELELGSGVPAPQLADLARVPRVAAVDDDGALAFLRYNRLQRSEIGWVDLQLLASAHARGIALWTFDEPLRAAAARVSLPALRPSTW